MLTTWEYSPEKEALRLLHTAHQLAAGFYRLNGFIVLPYPQYRPTQNQVAFPDLPYLSIPRFWNQAARINISEYPGIDMQVPASLSTSVEKLLASASLPQPDFTTVKAVWDKHEAEIISAIYEVIPSQKNSLKSILIWPTTLGTSCSFSLCKNPPHQLIIWLRQDQGPAAIVEAILTSLTRNQVYNELGGVWQESEIIVDWLMAYSPLNRLIKNIDPNWMNNLTIKHTRSKQNGTLAEVSQKFIEKLGAPIANPTKVPLENFSPKEKELLQLLISASPNPVSMDQIGDLIFKSNPEDYSLYAISKTIQRLRDRLEENGISGSFIQTKRGEGYLLVN